MSNTKFLIEPLWLEVAKGNLIGEEIFEMAKAIGLLMNDRKSFYTKILEVQFKNQEPYFFNELTKNKPLDIAFVETYNRYYILESNNPKEIVKAAEIFDEKEKYNRIYIFLERKYGRQKADMFKDLDKHMSTYEAFLLSADICYIREAKTVVEQRKRLYERENYTAYEVMVTSPDDFKIILEDYKVFGSFVFNFLSLQGHIDFINAANTNFNLKRYLKHFYKTKEVSNEVKQTAQYQEFMK